MMKNNLNLNQLLDLSDKALQNKDYIAAKKLLEKIISINNNIPEVYNNLGIIYLNSKNLKDAINYFSQAIKLNSKFSMAYCNLALAYDKSNQFEKAEENYLKAIETDKKNTVAHFNIGNLYKFKGDLEKAEKYLNEAINLNPNMIMAYNNLFEIFDRSNQFKKLEIILNKAKVKFGDHPLVNFFSGIYQYKKKNYNEVIKIFEKIILDKNDIGRLTVRNEFLAKSYDQVGNYDKAYKAFQSANNQINFFFQKKYNKKNYINFINKRVEYFTKKNVKKWTIEDQDKKKAPIFLIGFPRSGTTLLDTILRSHPMVEVLEEKPIVDIFISSLEKKTNNDLHNLENIDDNSIENLRKIYFDNRDKYINFDPEKIYIDKMPLNLIHVGEIVRIFPNAKFIFAIRNPYDVILSCFMQQFSPNNAMANLTNLDEGNHLITGYAVDGAGNLNSKTINVEVDLTNPEIEFVSPTPGNGEGRSNEFDIRANITEKNFKNLLEKKGLLQEFNEINEAVKSYSRNWSNKDYIKMINAIKNSEAYSFAKTIQDFIVNLRGK